MTGVFVFFLGGDFDFLASDTFLLAGTVLVCLTVVFLVTDQDFLLSAVVLGVLGLSSSVVLGVSGLSSSVVFFFLGSGATKGTGDR